MPVPVIVPQRRPLDFEDDDLAKEVDRLHTQGYDRAGDWDLAQVCDHLAKSMDASLDGFAFRAPWLFWALLAPIILRVVLKQRRMKAGFKAGRSLRAFEWPVIDKQTMLVQVRKFVQPGLSSPKRKHYAKSTVPHSRARLGPG